MVILHYPSDKKILDEKIFFYDSNDDSLLKKVADIIRKVKMGGDSVLCKFAREFDGINLTPDQIRFSIKEKHFSENVLRPELIEALDKAIENITTFHKLQLPQDIDYRGKYGEKLGQRFTSIDKVGIYVPGGTGGKTPLVSTLLMNVIPAQIAGVEQIVITTPPHDSSDKGDINPYLGYTLKRLGINEIYLSGGAQAIAAMAYGTETIPEVDLIVGPGNRYVNTAKKWVFGKVMIDALSGHSEIVIWAENGARPDWVAADLLSQAEHAGGELVVLVTQDEDYAKKVITEVEKQAEVRERKNLIHSSISKRGAVVLVNSPDQAVEVINYIAPEHIEVLHPQGKKYVKKIKHAGAIFIGEYASEPIGDYICGTNHVLPTNRSARFSSPLGVYTFLKRSNLIEYNDVAFKAYSHSAAILSELEQLTAHKYALEIRLSDNQKKLK